MATNTSSSLIDESTTVRIFTVTVNDSYGVSSYRSTGCLFNSLFWLTTKKHQRFALLSFVRESTGGLPAQRTVTRKNSFEYVNSYTINSAAWTAYHYTLNHIISVALWHRTALRIFGLWYGDAPASNAERWWFLCCQPTGALRHRGPHMTSLESEFQIWRTTNRLTD